MSAYRFICVLPHTRTSAQLSNTAVIISPSICVHVQSIWQCMWVASLHMRPESWHRHLASRMQKAGRPRTDELPPRNEDLANLVTGVETKTVEMTRILGKRRRRCYYFSEGGRTCGLVIYASSHFASRPYSRWARHRGC